MTVTELRPNQDQTPIAPDEGADSHRPLRDEADHFSDHLARLALGARWLTLLLGTVVVLRPGRAALDVAATGLLYLVAGFVTFRYVTSQSDNQRVFVLAEMVLCATAVALSGGIASPFVLAPAIPLMLAAFVLSERQAVVLAYVSAVLAVVLGLLQDNDDAATRSVALVGVVYLICGILGVITRRVVSDMDERRDEALVEVSRLTQANDLLVALHGLAQTMPATLDLAAVINDTKKRLNAAMPHTVSSLHIRNTATGHWHHEIAYGVKQTPPLTDEELPAVLASLVSRQQPLVVAEYLNTEAQGVSPFARSGIYCALRARGAVIGLLALESDQAANFDQRASLSLEQLAPDLALSFDNAMWFARLRTLGADTERARIARDLHDRIAQSLAYVSFELERHSYAAEPVSGEQLSQLREVIHEVVTELRDTLYDLRATISDEEDLASVAQGYLEKMRARHNFDVEYHGPHGQRLPTVVEQELWRIVQEGLHNIAKHAGADRVDLKYAIEGSHAQVELRDNGCGFVPRQVTSGHYGLMGMRERAEAIGASLDIASSPGRGTLIRISLEVAA